MATRPINPMPDDVAALLDAEGLRADYDARPHYQLGDYLGWFARAERDKTRQQRIRQMLDELREGGISMRMRHAPSRRR